MGYVQHNLIKSKNLTKAFVIIINIFSGGGCLETEGLACFSATKTEV